ncbi:MAG: bifunctional phosphoribosyl-AMP cyclohydrolase/phosphoribosyl-ATP diphosphatase HisIE [Sphaerochaetaceae bacterium]|nr:bifunctional phosphoribosyl-AMP cyclohydrolase/phosphoribosyl-ATP diphosphatase HisIE [Sphaerochaetaceae bacterium]
MEINFKKGNGLVPAIVQDSKTEKVLMLGYMNEESLKITEEKQLVTFWSRSRNCLWTKGETSGNYLKLEEILVDCDNDTLLIKANPTGPVCHTGKDTCFNEVNKKNYEDKNAGEFLEYLEAFIKNRKDNPEEGSYTNYLLDKGINRCAQKVGEEAVELIIEAKDNNEELFLGESADLIYHFLVLLIKKGNTLEQVTDVLKKRHKP